MTSRNLHQHASFDPPITNASLSELDTFGILGNPGLRHELNFDREVMFRPTTCRDQRERKKLEADAYWEALTIECAMSPWLHRSLSPLDTPLRLPRMFKVAQEILKTLVPRSEWLVIDQRLEIDLLLQQVKKGMCDIPTLIEWLGALLLRCCSPRRDAMITAMIDTAQTGSKNNDTRLLVNGLRRLFEILEQMKLVKLFFSSRCDRTYVFLGRCKPSNKKTTLVHCTRYRPI